MPRLDESRDGLIQALSDHYGPPATSVGLPDSRESLFERLARVMLGLVTTPQMAQAAFASLQEAGLLDPARLAAAHPLEIDDILKHDRIAMAIKSLRPLQNLARWAIEHAGEFDDAALSAQPTSTIRDEWRAINGIGLAKADALLLFGLGRPSYPLNRGTYRVLVRHGWLDPTADYDEARELVEKLVSDGSADRQAANHNNDNEVDPNQVAVVSLLEQLSGWFERLSRDFCKVSQARCERCPLHAWLPPNGPVEVD